MRPLIKWSVSVTLETDDSNHVVIEAYGPASALDFAIRDLKLSFSGSEFSATVHSLENFSQSTHLYRYRGILFPRVTLLPNKVSNDNDEVPVWLVASIFHQLSEKPENKDDFRTALAKFNRKEISVCFKGDRLSVMMVGEESHITKVLFDEDLKEEHVYEALRDLFNALDKQRTVE